MCIRDRFETPHLFPPRHVIGMPQEGPIFTCIDATGKYKEIDMKARSLFRILAVVLPALMILVVAQSAMAQAGRLTGRVTEASTGSPLPYANVVVVGTTMGGMTLTDGTFTITGVPVGTYTVKVMMMGYKPEEKTDVRIDASQTTRADFKLEEQIVGKTQEIVVEAEQVQIESRARQ